MGVDASHLLVHGRLEVREGVEVEVDIGAGRFDELAADLVCAKAEHAALRMPDDDDLLGTEQVLADDQRTDHVLGHELVHAFQYDMTNTNASSGNSGAMSLPLWFIEGMAEYLSIGPVDAHTAMWMREAVRREKFPEIKDLDDPRYFPYRYGQALWAFIGGKYGDRTIGDLLSVAAGRNGYEGAFRQLLGVDSKELSREWHEAELAVYRPIAEATKMPASFAQPLITKQHSGGGMNVSPELSPDGTRIMFFSERDLFSIDLYLADARTGKVIRKITDTATDPHF